MDPSDKVPEWVAKAEDTEPSELGPELFEVVDPDALDKLFKSLESGPARAEGVVKFPYAGYDVQITADGEVTIQER